MIANPRSRLLIGTFVALCTGALGQTAFAQTNDRALGEAVRSLAGASQPNSNFKRDRNISVRQRPRPDYAPLGIDLGAFTGQAQVQITADYYDNVFATPVGQSDVALTVSPDFSVSSNWSRHRVTGYARGIFTRFNDFESENTDQYSFGGTGRLDVARTGIVALSADFSHRAESRVLANSPALAAEPIEFDVASLALASAYEFNRLELSGVLGWRELDFDDTAAIGGGILDQDERDFDSFAISGRADFAISPATALFLETTWEERDYRLTPPPPGVDRNSSGYEVLVGANFELTSLIRGDIGVGYIERDYDSNLLGDVESVAVRGRLEWFPTQLTTVTLTAARSAEETGVTGAAGYLSSNLALQVDHELRRNIILTGYVGAGDDEFDGIDREDERTNVSLGATWLLNRRVALIGTVSHFDVESRGINAGREFDLNRISIGVNLQY